MQHASEVTTQWAGLVSISCHVKGSGQGLLHAAKHALYTTTLPCVCLPAAAARYSRMSWKSTVAWTSVQVDNVGQLHAWTSFLSRTELQCSAPFAACQEPTVTRRVALAAVV